MNYTDVELYIVVCLEHGEGYVLATRHVFENRAAAELYAASCSQSRKPLVISGRFAQLRLPAAGTPLP